MLSSKKENQYSVVKEQGGSDVLFFPDTPKNGTSNEFSKNPIQMVVLPLTLFWRYVGSTDISIWSSPMISRRESATLLQFSRIQAIKEGSWQYALPPILSHGHPFRRPPI